MSRPLEGIRVLDLTHVLAGPFCTQILGDLGAEVIKIETPGLGDYLRIIPPYVRDATGADVSALFQLINRGKKSVALNFRNKRGKDVLLRLAKNADVLIEAFRPGAADRWGIGYEQEIHMLRVNISNLRRKIEPDPTRPRHVLTEPGVGYRLRANV